MSYNYVDGLDSKSRERYHQKLCVVGLDQCPFQYAASLWIDDPTQWPDVQYPDIYSYLVETPGVFTKEAMKNYRSTEAWRMLESGWVQTVQHMTTRKNIIIFKVKVMPSMRVNDPPHDTWAAVEKSGTVLAAHCTCKAGLGESCYHVGALLYKVEYANRMGYNKQVCTDRPCVWNNDFVRRVAPAPMKKVLIASQASTAKLRHKNVPVAPSTEQEQQNLLQLLNMCPTKPVVLSTYNAYARDFKSQPVDERKKLPTDMRSLYDPSSRKWSDQEMETKLSTMMNNLQTTAVEITFLQSQTISQSNSLVWHKMRAGRITSSTAHQAMRTSLETPSESLTKKICCNEPSTLSTAAVLWGREHEKDGIAAYVETMSGHDGFGIHKCGLSILEDMPFLGASPDGLVQCHCCGSRVLEVKCPKSHENCLNEQELYKDKRMGFNSDGTVNKNHQYYTQMQMHMLVYDTDVCDFVTWTPNVVVIKSVQRDRKYGLEIVRRCGKYFRQVILVELVTRSLEMGSTLDDKENINGTLYCICQTPEAEWDDDETMVACDNAACQYQWYHLRCLKRKTVPKGEWYCRQCSLKRKKSQKHTTAKKFKY